MGSAKDGSKSSRMVTTLSSRSNGRGTSPDGDHSSDDLEHQNHQYGGKDALLSALEVKDKEIAQLKRYALMSPDAIINSSDGEISNLRQQLAEAAQALERAGAPVPRCLEAAQDKTTQAFI